MYNERRYNISDYSDLYKTYFWDFSFSQTYDRLCTLCLKKPGYLYGRYLENFLTNMAVKEF